MAKLNWDESGKKFYEVGVDHAVLYLQSSGTEYDKGYAWNGLSSVSESPEGAEPTDIYADNIKYASLRSAENYKGSIEAYMYPDEFGVCDGSATPTPGLYIGQQTRKPFGLCYRTRIGNDANPELGYKLHLIYNASVTPSEKTHETVNDSPDVSPMSWDFDTVPVNVEGYKPTAKLTIDSTKVNADKLKALEDILFGTEILEPKLPTPDEVVKALTEAA